MEVKGGTLLRKVINGRVYNTATSKLVGSDNKAHQLYKNPKGAYFLYSAKVKKIAPLNSEAAQEWAYKNLNMEEYEAEFGDMGELKSDLITRERVNLSLDIKILADLRNYAVKNHIAMGRMVDNALLIVYGEEFEKLNKNDESSDIK